MSSDIPVNSDSLTLEETNRVRVSLGLKPIGEAAAEGEDVPVDTDLLAEENYAQRRVEMAAEKKERELKEKIDKARNRSALNSKLKGTTLGSTNADDALSAKAWLKKQKKRAKDNERDMAQRRAKDMEEQDAAEYGERDVAGLKVNHAADDFETGEEVILTLKDSRVLAGDEDELQNVNLIEDEVLKAAKERKRKAQAAYTGYDDEEFDEGRIGQKADILGKYDDSFATGKVRSEGFRLGAPPKQEEKVEEDTEMIGSAPMTKVKLNLDYAKDFEVGDYAKEGEAGFKKPKKKKAKRSTRKTEVDEEDDGMEVDSEPRLGKRKMEDGPQNLVDDDDLQAALARSRRETARRKPKVKAEDMAARIASSRQDEETAAPQENGDEDGRITFDDTSEFVRNVTLDSLSRPVKRERASSAQPTADASSSFAPAAAEPTIIKVKIERPEDGELGDEDEVMSEDEDEGLAEMAAREGMSLAEYRMKIDAQMQEMSELKPEEDEEASAPVVGSGMSGYLNLLRQSGALQKRSTEDAEREEAQVKYDLWIADHRARMAKREVERLQARNKPVDQAQKEWENKMREKKEAEEARRAYESYKPDINIVYHDEFGRTMTPKEAWKSLSHKFHGKTSGRMKTEKRLKKIAEERKQEQMLASDTPTGMTDAFSRRQQKTGEAHMVLSVGNKGSVQAPSAGKKRR
ncbi:SART-1 protein [Dioszegia hungarica]|uniref:SART-1 protein n=1 Tax=Dioszegia hungarica TaxID=4972 RepID=A0AA38LSY3_9TREE|nr:SART-1 protein [Dioszegia hungarica]KAI9633988.1 SART-1 protein [Dioszegia hungarica]